MMSLCLVTADWTVSNFLENTVTEKGKNKELVIIVVTLESFIVVLDWLIGAEVL